MNSAGIADDMLLFQPFMRCKNFNPSELKGLLIEVVGKAFDFLAILHFVYKKPNVANNLKTG